MRKKDVVEAVDKSLKRLDMDHIDLLQVDVDMHSKHWVNAYVSTCEGYHINCTTVQCSHHISYISFGLLSP